MERIIEDVIAEDNDPLDVLEQFKDEPIDSNESFDLIIPALDPSEPEDLFDSIVSKDFNEDDEGPAIKKPKKDSLLLNLLSKPGPSSPYVQQPKSGLSSLSTQTPNIKIGQQAFLSKRQNSDNSKKAPIAILPKSQHQLEEVSKLKTTKNTLLVNQTTNCSKEENFPLKLLAIADLEFDILELRRQRGYSDCDVNYHSYYSVAVFQLGCLFFPMKNVSIVEQILVEDDSKKFISTRWTKDDPSRNSHDTVHFTSLNMSAKKPGKSQDVFLKISDGDLFFLGCNSIGKVVGLYHKLFANGSFLSRMEIVFKKEWLKNYYMNLDIITFLDAQKHIMERKSQAVLQELSKISSQKLVSRPIISCSICCKKFHILSEYMYHRFLCNNNKSSEPFKLKLMIKECSDKSQPLTRDCLICLRKFTNHIVYILHQDCHVQKGSLFPCYLCSKLFLTAFAFINHQCLKNRKLSRRRHLNVSSIPTNSGLYKKVSSQLLSQILRCYTCGKMTSSISQLLSHLHTGSDCLTNYFTNKIMTLDTDLGVNLATALMSTTSNVMVQDVVIQCEVCDEQCLGVVSYLLHMDHHKLDVALECAQCRRSMATYCQFYSHYCDQLQFRSCIFCEEMRMSEVNALKSPDVIDPKYLVKDAVNLFTRIIHFKDDVTIVNNEDEGFKDTGVDLVFLDFHLQHQLQKSSNVENENVTQIPIVDILDD